MNKQALAFLTMFSLILMLSVYYVTLPADSTSVMEEQAPQSDKKADKENTAAKTEDAQGKTEEAQEQKKRYIRIGRWFNKAAGQQSIRKRKRRSTAIPSVRYFINSSTLLANNSPSFSMTETVFSISAVLLVPLYRFPR